MKNYKVVASGSRAVLSDKFFSTLKEAKASIDSRILCLAVDHDCLHASAVIFDADTNEAKYGKEWESDMQGSDLPKKFQYGVGVRYGLMSKLALESQTEMHRALANRY